MKVTIGQPFAFEHKAQSVNGVFEISLRRRFTALLQFVEIVFDLVFVQFRWQAAEVQSHGCYVTAVVIKGTWTSAEDGYVALKTLQQFCKSINFVAGTIEIFIIPQFFRRFFFVAIINCILVNAKFTDSCGRLP